MLSEMRENIEKYNKIFIWNISSVDMWRWFKGFYKLIIDSSYTDILLAYTTDFVPEDECEVLSVPDRRILMKKLDEQQVNGIMEMYHMYEFSNKIHVISENPQYPSMLNYVTLGVLTEEEFYKALLY